MGWFETRKVSPVVEVGDSVTARYDLPTDGAICSIHLNIVGTGGASSVANIESVFTNIRVIGNNGNVLWKNNLGTDLAELNAWTYALDEAQIVTEADGANTEWNAYIDFGRPKMKGRDPKYNLWAPGFKQLKLQIDCGTVVGAAKWAAANPASTLSVVIYHGGSPKPIGRWFEETSFASSAATTYENLSAQGELTATYISASATIATDIVEVNTEIDNGRITLDEGVDSLMLRRLAMQQSFHDIDSIPTLVLISQFSTPGEFTGAFNLNNGQHKARLKIEQLAGSTVRIGYHEVLTPSQYLGSSEATGPAAGSPRRRSAFGRR